MVMCDFWLASRLDKYQINKSLLIIPFGLRFSKPFRKDFLLRWAQSSRRFTYLRTDSFKFCQIFDLVVGWQRLQLNWLTIFCVDVTQDQYSRLHRINVDSYRTVSWCEINNGATVDPSSGCRSRFIDWWHQKFGRSDKPLHFRNIRFRSGYTFTTNALRTKIQATCAQMRSGGGNIYKRTCQQQVVFLLISHFSCYRTDSRHISPPPHLIWFDCWHAAHLLEMLPNLLPSDKP